jgi:hypothetical protein
MATQMEIPQISMSGSKAGLRTNHFWNNTENDGNERVLAFSCYSEAPNCHSSEKRNHLPTQPSVPSGNQGKVGQYSAKEKHQQTWNDTCWAWIGIKVGRSK